MNGRASVLACLLGLLAACAHDAPSAGAPAAAAAPEAPRFHVAMNRSLVEQLESQRDRFGVWVGYGQAWGGIVGSDPAALGPKRLESEAVVLEVMVLLWSKRREHGAPPDPYLDALVRVSEAAFTREYVLKYLSRPGWFVSPEVARGLRLEGFAEWMARELPGHVVERSASMVEADGGIPDAQPVPGNDLPDAEAAGECAEAMPKLEPAIARWAELEAALPAVPIASRTPEELFEVLRMRARDPAILERGALPVSPRVDALLFRAGWCSNERADFEAASRYLGKLVALNPRHTAAYSELAHARANAGDLDGALGVVNGALQLPVDPCETARLLRQRGFIHVEKGDLELARFSYRQSLELEPGSAVALNELVLIEELVRRHGRTNGVASPPPYQPIPFENLKTKCVAPGG